MKKGNLFKNLVIFILVLTMLVPASTVNVKADDSTDANYDPNIYVDNDGVSHLISELPSYYEHEHLTEKYLKKHPEMLEYEKNNKGISKYRYDIKSKYVDINVCRTANFERDGVASIYCSLCKKTILFRIPKLKKLQYKKKYTWDEIILAYEKEQPELWNGGPWEIPDYLIYRDTYYTDIDNNKIETSAGHSPMGKNPNKEGGKYYYNSTILGTIDYTVSISPNVGAAIFYDVNDADCYYVVNAPDVCIVGFDFAMNDMAPIRYTYTKNKEFYKLVKKYKIDFENPVEELKLVDGTEIKMSINKNFKTNVITVKGKNASFDSKKVKYNTNYYVKCRTYKIVEGKYYYSKWTSVTIM